MARIDADGEAFHPRHPRFQIFSGKEKVHPNLRPSADEKLPGVMSRGRVRTSSASSDIQTTGCAGCTPMFLSADFP
jgi:hypothetical protein